ncbi:MAG: hypothetical protein K2R98_27480 [Gemmataceae bacterium]|nr:hypothetical protein [Gemmataceae bacterium]
MANRPQMPVPGGELSPQAVCDAIRDWAESHGCTFQQLPHAGEYAKVIVRVPGSGTSFTTVHNAHRGRRLRRDQVRYAVGNLNKNWRGLT